MDSKQAMVFDMLWNTFSIFNQTVFFLFIGVFRRFLRVVALSVLAGGDLEAYFLLRVQSERFFFWNNEM